MNDDSIATHMYCHVLSVLLTGQKKKKREKITTILLTSFKIAMSLLKVVNLQFELNVYKVMCNWRHSHDASRQIIS